MTDQVLGKKIYVSALAILARREHSQAELRDKLMRQYPSHDLWVEQVLERLVIEGYQSDERFIEVYLRSRISKGYGTQRLRQELRSKGLDAAVIEEALNQHLNGLVIYEQMTNVWTKKFGYLPETPKQKNQQMQFLLYRGFRSNEVRSFFERMSDVESES